MMRVCNLDTCPVGVATQNPELRKRFRGKPEYVENFMKFIAEELREYMARLGVRTVDEMVGRSAVSYTHLAHPQEKWKLQQAVPRWRQDDGHFPRWQLRYGGDLHSRPRP